MSLLSQPHDQREQAPSTSSSSFVKSNGSLAIPPSTTLLFGPDAMSRRQGRVFSQSSPTLANRPDEGHNSADAGSESSAAYTARNHSHGAVASHFLAQPPEAYGGQTWMDFLRESGAQQQPPSQPHWNQHGELYPQANSSSRYSLPNRSHRFSEASATLSRSTDRRRRLTMPDPHMRRHSSLRTRSVGGSSNLELGGSNPVALSSPPPPRSSYPSHYFRSHALGSPRRDSDIVLPLWQSDDEVTECPVCERPFTFLYRRHHCRKCGRVVCSTCSPHRITIPRQFVVRPPSDPMTIQFFSESDSDGNYSNPFSNPALGGGEEVRVCNPCVPDPNYNPPPQEHSRHAAFFANASQQQNYPFNSRRSGFSQSYSPHSNQHQQTPASPTRTPQYHASPTAQSHTSQTQVQTPRYTEEDFCVVCNILLPPISPSGDDTARTQHLDSHFNNATPPDSSSPNNTGQSSTTRHSLNARGFFPYTATEKDCVTQDGSSAECDICLEDFENGDQLARLACWCRFHRHCIETWWDRKGWRVCPSHPEQV